jgi:hypothetical protein
VAERTGPAHAPSGTLQLGRECGVEVARDQVERRVLALRGSIDGA